MASALPIAPGDRDPPEQTLQDLMMLGEGQRFLFAFFPIGGPTI